ncbi:hypothetical protein [Agromyces albus]|uniref:hypothetical protein n=1 Tax=Agromyces albus TaxID=205332 RepID=UPI002780ECD1|nr:hypothetical protein [Agromyces albus]MDQ0576468.1 hypothetical protein [Agromyces albus]
MQPYEFAPDSRPPAEAFEEESWTHVSGGGLPAPIYIRVSRAANGRPVVTGLVVGATWPNAEITADVLRSIRLGEIVRELHKGFSPTEVPPYDDFRAQIEWALMHQTYVEGAATLTEPSRAFRGDEERLRVFARTYQANIVRSPRSPMAATLRDLENRQEFLKISRATLYRWLERCRDLGLLPRT